MYYHDSVSEIEIFDLSNDHPLSYIHITFTKFLLDVGEYNINLERILNTNTIRIPDNLLIPSNMPIIPDTIYIDTSLRDLSELLTNKQ